MNLLQLDAMLKRATLESVQEFRRRFVVLLEEAFAPVLYVVRVVARQLILQVAGQRDRQPFGINAYTGVGSAQQDLKPERLCNL